MNTLHEERIAAVVREVRDSGARRVLDLGCGSGPLVDRLLQLEQVEEVVGVDLSASALETVRARHGGGRPGLRLMNASFTECDPRLRGYDAAVFLETIEHIDPAELSRLEQATFAFHRPRHVIITTPNVEANALLGVPAGRRRHPGHRFEWTREKFRRWASGVAGRRGYGVRIVGVGPEHPVFGAPTQMAAFNLAA